MECFCCCSVIIVLVLVVFLVVFIDVSTPRSRTLTPPLPHTPRPRSRIYRRFVTSHRPPAGTPSLLKKDYIKKDCKTHHFPPPRRQTREDSSVRPRGTVPELLSVLMLAPPLPHTPSNSHFVRRVKLRLAYRLAFVTKSLTQHISALYKILA